MSKIALLYAVFFIFIFRAGATVNPVSGDLLISALDIRYKFADAEFELYRYYNQNTLAEGILGKKWCFNIEQKLIFAADGIGIMSCGITTRILFQKNKSNQYVWNDELLEKKNDGISHSYIRRSNGLEYNYDEYGQLKSIQKINLPKSKIQITYSDENSLIEAVVINKENQFKFKYNEDKILQEIIGPKNFSVRYSSQIAGEKINVITEVKNFWQNTYLYKYDQKLNLISIDYPNKEKEQFSYNPKSNFISGLVTRYGCEKKYDYSVDSQTKSSTTKVYNSCTGKTTQYTDKKSPQFYSNRLKIQDLAMKLSQTRVPAAINAAKNKPLNSVSGDLAYSYKHNDKGQVIQIQILHSITNEKNVINFEYKSDVVSSMSSKSLGVIEFEYDAYGVLRKQNESDGTENSRLKMLSAYDHYLKLKNNNSVTSSEVKKYD